MGPKKSARSLESIRLERIEVTLQNKSESTDKRASHNKEKRPIEQLYQIQLESLILAQNER